MIKLKEIEAYKTSSKASSLIWNLVVKWPILGQRTLGQQWVRSVDSIAANIAEGEGRYFKRDKMKFFYQARGSLYESVLWAEKAVERKLISQIEYEKVMTLFRKLPKQINSLISGASKNLKR